MKKLIVLAAALCMVATSAYAADWNFYGSSRVATIYTKVESNGLVPDQETTNLAETLQTNSKIGATVKASDSLTGQFEYGSTPNLRRLFGTWNFGGGTLLVGQEYTPLFTVISNQIYGDDVDLLTYGGFYGGRLAQLRLTFGNFQIAAIAPNANLDPATVIGVGNSEILLPKFEAAYRIAQDNWWAKIGAGYQTFDMYNAASQTGSSNDITSYVGLLAAGITFGPATFSGEVFGGQNAGHFAVMSVSNATLATSRAYGVAKYTAATNSVVDNDCIGFNLVASYKANDMFTFEAGLGQAKTELDESAAIKDDVTSYYLQAVITLAKGVTITPEIGRVDFNQNDTLANSPTNTYFGAKWQLDF